MTLPYAELQCVTNFSFLRGGSHGEELVACAEALGLEALAVTDHNTVAGVVRAHLAARSTALKFIPAARLDLRDAPSLLAYPTDRPAWGRLTRLLTLGQRRAEKGDCELTLQDVAAHANGLIFLAVPPEAGAEAALRRLEETLPAPLYLSASHRYRGDDRERIAALDTLAHRCGTPLVATGDVLYHTPNRRPLQDVLTCIREKCTIAEAGLRLEANAERHLKGPGEMARLFAGFEDALTRTVKIADACTFSLDELVYEYPDEPVPPGKSPQQHLEDLAWDGANWRFPDGLPHKVRDLIERELKLIDQLNYAPYFLTVYDIVRYARSQGILCQGRGSAANSAVCYCLAITNVNPAEIDLLFERFISPERQEPPDIDVDFEHERREEVIQYIYARYGRERAALSATVISYRRRSAVREVGKAMGLSEDTVSALASTVWHSHSGGSLPETHVREAGLDPGDPLLARTLELSGELMGFPRHLSQHVGGFVLTRGPLSEVVPIANAAMEDRTVIEWDKDDLDALGLLKVDVLGLGMLTCIRKCFTLIEAQYGRKLTLADVPDKDEATYDMLCRADSIGVFQVESRAQMNMLPRLKPRCFYDLVIEVAIVRPGPIQGDMVHPYLRRRDKLEPVEYPRPAPEHGTADELEAVLKKTLGVPLFQEQAMKIAIVAAKFSADEANQLRHAMATFRRRGTINTLKDKFVGRMIDRGYAPEMAERCFKQIEGFGEYGFPESHSASFSLLVYISAWLKCHYPEAFACGLLNSQPMGFYAPAQIVRCAREHGVEARAVDINHSDWESTLEPRGNGKACALRLGLRQVDGLREDDAEKIVQARAEGAYASVGEIMRRAGVSRAALERLAAADAFRSMGLDRRQALWEVRALADAPALPLFEYALQEARSAEGTTGTRRENRATRGKAERPPPGQSLSPTGSGSAPAQAPPEAGTAVSDKQEARSAEDTTGTKRENRATRGKAERPPPGQSLSPTGSGSAPAQAPPEAGSAVSDIQTDLIPEPKVLLPEMPLCEHVSNDYQTLRLSLKAHPMQFLRGLCKADKALSCEEIAATRDGQFVTAAGVVLVRQRPGTAKGVVFMTIEDETGIANVVIWSKVLEKYRRQVMGSRLAWVRGRIQRHEDIIHLVANRIEDRSHWLDYLSDGTVELEPGHLLANADEVRRPEPGSWRGREGQNPRRHPRSVRIIPKSRDFH